MIESLDYKHSDYSIRAVDPYATSKYQVILRWLPQTPDLRVLNAGCGSGEMSALLAQQRTWQIDAIDVDEEAVRLSQQLRDQLALPNLDIKRASIENHDQRNYDVIISNDVLEHIEDDQTAIAKLADLLKPGGILFVSVPALQWLFGHHDRMLGHYRRYNRQLLTERLQPHFEMRRCRYFGATLIPIAALYSVILRRAYPVGKQRKGSLTELGLSTLLTLERNIALPLGTSVLAMAVKRD